MTRSQEEGGAAPRAFVEVPRELLATADRLRSLSDRARAMLVLLAVGATDAAIAHRIGCSTATVRRDLREAREHLGVGSRAELARHGALLQRRPGTG